MSTDSTPLLTPELLAQLERLELVSRKIFRGRIKGERRSLRKGQSVEFADFRSYVPGDDLRFVDWNTYARLDRLFLKLFLEEEDLHFYALIDASASMNFGTPTKLEFAKRLAAALGFIGLIRSDRVKIETLGQAAGQPGPSLRGRQSVWRMLDYLSAIQATETTSFSAGIKNFCLRNSGRGIVVVISDMLDKQGYEEGLRFLTAQRMDPYIVQVLAEEEVEPDVKGDLRLVDCEDADEAEITVSLPLLRRYKQTLTSFLGGVQSFCTQRGMGYLLARSNQPVDQLVSGYLRARIDPMTWPQWTSMLGFWQWAALAVIPPAIIALYFLKLKRQPLEVPSTYLWHKSIDDLRVNSIWQRLRQSLLLFLQLLLLALLALALLRPSWQGSKFERDRLVFLIDNSASMGATDVAPSRLDEAKRRVRELIDQMRSGDVAMIVSFADSARVEQMFTDNRGELRRRLELIQPTDRPTSITEALRVASVLANPGRDGADTSGLDSPRGLPAQLFFFSDGNFADDPEFSLGNLEPTPPVWIGEPDAANVAIVAFNTARSEADAEKVQAFARLENSGPQDVKLDVELLSAGELIDAQSVSVPAGKSSGVSFDLEHFTSGALFELRLDEDDALAVDNRAWTVVNAPRRSRVLFVTPGNEPLQTALATHAAHEMAEITKKGPDFLTTPQYRQTAAAGDWDLVIYDRCRPDEAPQANTLYIGRLPAGEAWQQKEAVTVPQIIDVNRAHPLMQWLDMSDVLVIEAQPLVAPRGATPLIEAIEGPLLAVGPREGYEDVVTAFELVGNERIGTNWPVRPSFPVFVLNSLAYLGGNREAGKTRTVQPGHAVVLKSPSDARELSIVPPGPDVGTVNVVRDRHNEFHFTATNRVGLYRAREENRDVDSFAVNLFDPRESDVKVQADRKLKIGHDEVASGEGWEESRRDAWKFILLGALAILLCEWYIYNRRAYL